MGEPSAAMHYRFMSKVVNRGEPGEVKHLSNPRKRNQTRLREQWRTKLQEPKSQKQDSRIAWEGKRKSVIVTYTTFCDDEREQSGTRGILFEDRGTIL